MYRAKYKVDSMVIITTKPIVDKMREMFEILKNIGIILLGQDVIPINPPPRIITIFIGQLFTSLRIPFPPLVNEFLYRVRTFPGQFSPNFWRIILSCYVM